MPNVRLLACVLARIIVTVTLSGSDSGFLGVSSVLLIRGAVASEPPPPPEPYT